MYFFIFSELLDVSKRFLRVVKSTLTLVKKYTSTVSGVILSFLHGEIHRAVEHIINLSNKAKKNKSEDNCGTNIQGNNKGN